MSQVCAKFVGEELGGWEEAPAHSQRAGWDPGSRNGLFSMGKANHTTWKDKTHE